MERLSVCPACESTTFSPVMHCIDYTVSKESFSIVKCTSCELEFTNPRPAQQEIGAYYQSDAYVSHTDENAPGLINTIYRLVRNYTLGSKRKLIEKLQSKGSLLDIGCGTGAFAANMQAAGWKVQGVEPDEGAAARARKRGLKVEPEQWLEGCSEQFEVITMWHVLEHVHDLKTRFSQLYSLCKPGGWVIIAVPNPRSIDAAHYGNLWAAHDVPRHLYHFPPTMLRKRMQNQGFDVVGTKGMPFDPFYISMLSEKYKRGKDALLTAIIKGKYFWVRSFLGKDLWSSQIYLFRKPL
ncbi:MAG: hypothetical protein C0424_01695 [Sphingobacteriaceae bacterium]|nr:hypothetical protein [Sphingobacteriaceae bacterium]